jgi:transposase
VPITTDILPDGVEALKAALVAERQARQQAEARATGAEAMVAQLKLVIAKLRRRRESGKGLASSDSSRHVCRRR